MAWRLSEIQVPTSNGTQPKNNNNTALPSALATIKTAHKVEDESQHMQQNIHQTVIFVFTHAARNTGGNHSNGAVV